mmetsp:Transcript_1265/g.1682  ORF Transcript_1265/g.1682 Transcript_1265/m.1682 type:complete len:108 (+) Transcript_1265:511-834(+)
MRYFEILALLEYVVCQRFHFILSWTGAHQYLKHPVFSFHSLMNWSKPIFKAQACFIFSPCGETKSSEVKDSFTWIFAAHKQLGQPPSFWILSFFLLHLCFQLKVIIS